MNDLQETRLQLEQMVKELNTLKLENEKLHRECGTHIDEKQAIQSQVRLGSQSHFFYIYFGDVDEVFVKTGMLKEHWRTFQVLKPKCHP